MPNSNNNTSNVATQERRQGILVKVPVAQHRMLKIASIEAGVTLQDLVTRMLQDSIEKAGRGRARKL